MANLDIVLPPEVAETIQAGKQVVETMVANALEREMGEDVHVSIVAQEGVSPGSITYWTMGDVERRPHLNNSIWRWWLDACAILTVTSPDLIVAVEPLIPDG